MKTPFKLAEYPRRWAQPLSSPPPGYFERLPTQVMARVAAPPGRQAPSLAWLLRMPAALRTGLASTLLLGTFAASLWLGSSPVALSPTATLDGVPREQLVEYLTSGETHVDMLDLSELPGPHVGLAPQYLHPSASELTQALDEQPADESIVF